MLVRTYSKYEKKTVSQHIRDAVSDYRGVWNIEYPVEMMLALHHSSDMLPDYIEQELQNEYH